MKAVVQEKLGVQPGERSGELQLLTPGEAPVKVAAAPQNVPLPSKPKTDLYEDSSQSSSPFLASSSSFPAGKRLGKRMSCLVSTAQSWF